MRALSDELLNQTFQLAYFIHPDERAAAARITAAALESLETTTLAQDKRFYHPGRRTKVSFTEFHLLQRLVYEKSAPFERAREADPARAPRAARLLVHFIKHLVWITVRRNSFYVTLGLGRLLHRYTTAETLELYNVILQDPNRVPAEDYCRNRKKKLMEELLNRFGAMLATTQESRGALRFVTHDRPARFAALVNDCLAAFTPWQTGCHVPERFVPTDTALPDFSFSGPDPDAEHPVEIKRYHALLHPDCLARLLHALGYAPAAERLEIPRFYLANQADDTGPDDSADGGAPLTDGERAELRDHLRDREQRRKTARARRLRFVANGDEVARLDLEQSEQVRFTLPEYAEFLEIRAADTPDDLLLATHRLRYDDDDQLRAQDAVIVLQNGRRLAFTITAAAATITVAGATSHPIHAVRRWLQRHNAPAALLGPIWQPALSLLLLALLTGGIAWLLFNKPATPEPNIAKTASPTPAPQVTPTSAPAASPSPQPKPTISPTPRTPARPAAPNDEVLVRYIPVESNSASLTRGEREAAATGLLEARKVFLQIGGGTEQLRSLVGEQIRTQLPAVVPFALTDDRNAGDIALKLKITPRPAKGAAKRLTLKAQIVAASSQVIWPLTSGFDAVEYQGAVNKVVTKLSAQLSDDLKKMRK